MSKKHIISKSALKKLILEEAREIRRQQILKEQLNEGLWDMIGGLFGNLAGGVTDSIKSAICNFLLARLGASREDFMGQVICNAFEEMEISEWASIFSGDPNRCQIIGQNILEALAETIAERTADQAFDIDENSWLYRAIGAPAQEAIQNSIIRNSELTRSVGQAICDLADNALDIFQNAGVEGEQANSLVSGISSLFGGSSGAAPRAAAPAAPAST